jgi:phosphatidylinositol 4-kinase
LAPIRETEGENANEGLRPEALIHADQQIKDIEGGEQPFDNFYERETRPKSNTMNFNNKNMGVSRQTEESKARDSYHDRSLAKLPHHESGAVKETGLDNDQMFEERPEGSIFKETSLEQDARIKKNSPFGHLKTWKLLRVIVKSNDDVRQEQFAMQCISVMAQIFKEKNLPLWVKEYEILATGPRCGLI